MSNNEPLAGAAGHSRWPAFTLLELLVVISIISLLAAILFPVFARVRENARRTSCVSNLKNIGLSLVMYSQDYDEKVIAAKTNANAADTTWIAPFQPYIRSWQVVKCPSALVSSRSTDYNCNRIVLDAANNAESVPVPLNAFNSTRTMFAMDGSGSSNWSDAYYTYDRIGDDGTATGCANYCVSMRHLEGFNAAFLDGHAKWVSRNRVYIRYDGRAVTKFSTYYDPTDANFASTAKTKFDPSIWYTAP